MLNKTSAIISVIVTAGLLTLGYGITSSVAKGKEQSANATITAEYYATREAQYQELIAQANNTISQANEQILALEGQISPTATPYPVSVEQAQAIAENVSGETASQAPTLVNYTGTVAYEVNFPDGKVYVDASSGSVLYNGVIVLRTITNQQAAQIAINYTGNSQVSEVVTGYYSGAAAYRVTFQNGEIVYMDMYGNILAYQPAPAARSGGESEDHDDD
jgi:uncharacterized membrane protein YkoI